MKKCYVCGKLKALGEFYRREGSPDGYRNDCKECRKARSMRNYFASHDTNKLKLRLRHKKRIEDNPNWYAEKYRSDRKKSLAESRQSYIKNRDVRVRAAVEWARNNKGKANANKKAYKASKLKACPIWVRENQDYTWMIQETYDLASLRTSIFGFQWHVDHIVPLRGRNVSGLHVPWNLQVIPGSENCRKGNKLVVD